jgi:hypothetical protein
MSVEFEVNLRPTGAAPNPVVDREVVAANRFRAREERFLRRATLARVVEARIAAGEFDDMADPARRRHVSRARMSKFVAWRAAPDRVEDWRSPA